MRGENVVFLGLKWGICVEIECVQENFEIAINGESTNGITIITTIPVKPTLSAPTLHILFISCRHPAALWQG